METFTLMMQEIIDYRLASYELRIKLGSDICRLFYFYWKDKIYVVTSGYIKKTNKTDKRQIEKAIKIKNQFMEQNK